MARVSTITESCSEPVNNSPDDGNADVIAVNDGEWKDWTSTWRKAGNPSHSRHVTMTGTVTRGKKRGQSVDVELDLTDHELMQMTISREQLNDENPDNEVSSDGICGLASGFHIILLGVICFPFIFIGAFFVCLYFGLLTWHNIFTYYYDERTICHRITICPALLLLFPFLIITFSLSLAIYAAFVQFSWKFDDWKIEVGSFEKGFYGWFCSRLSLESCSPYMVVTLSESECPVFQDARHLPTSDNVDVRARRIAEGHRANSVEMQELVSNEPTENQRNPRRSDISLT